MAPHSYAGGGDVIHTLMAEFNIVEDPPGQCYVAERTTSPSAQRTLLFGYYLIGDMRSRSGGLHALFPRRVQNWMPNETSSSSGDWLTTASKFFSTLTTDTGAKSLINTLPLIRSGWRRRYLLVTTPQRRPDSGAPDGSRDRRQTGE